MGIIDQTTYTLTCPKCGASESQKVLDKGSNWSGSHGGKAVRALRTSKQPGMAKAGLLSPSCPSRLVRVASPRPRLPSADRPGRAAVGRMRNPPG